jgi:hypothetical protein
MLAGLSIGELVSLCESKRDLLQREGWQGEMGRLCLDFVVALAGFSWPEPPTACTGHVNGSDLSPEQVSTVNHSDAFSNWLVLGSLTERGSPAPTPNSSCASPTTHGIVFVSRHIDVICYRRSSTIRNQRLRSKSQFCNTARQRPDHRTPCCRAAN